MDLMGAWEPEHNVTQAALAQPSASGKLADLQIAEFIVQALLDVPGVGALSVGRLGTAATYGPGQTVRGVAVRHVQDDAYTLEVHVVVASAELVDDSAGHRDIGQEAGGGSPAMLPALAEAIRSHLASVLRGRGVTSPAAVDVFFDDWT